MYSKNNVKLKRSTVIHVADQTVDRPGSPHEQEGTTALCPQKTIRFATAMVVIATREFIRNGPAILYFVGAADWVWKEPR